MTRANGEGRPAVATPIGPEEERYDRYPATPA